MQRRKFDRNTHEIRQLAIACSFSDFINRIGKGFIIALGIFQCAGSFTQHEMRAEKAHPLFGLCTNRRPLHALNQRGQNAFRCFTRDDYLLSYTAKLSPKMLNRSMLVFVEVKLDHTTPEIFETFAEATKNNSMVMEEVKETSAIGI